MERRRPELLHRCNEKPRCCAPILDGEDYVPGGDMSSGGDIKDEAHVRAKACADASPQNLLFLGSSGPQRQLPQHRLSCDHTDPEPGGTFLLFSLTGAPELIASASGGRPSSGLFVPPCRQKAKEISAAETQNAYAR